MSLLTLLIVFSENGLKLFAKICLPELETIIAFVTMLVLIICKVLEFCCVFFQDFVSNVVFFVRVVRVANNGKGSSSGLPGRNFLQVAVT